MNAPFLRIERWDEIPGAISRMQAAGAGHRVPLMQALYHGRIAHLELPRGGSVGLFKRWRNAIRLPGVLLLGDDDHSAAAGPETWPIAKRAMEWARFILIHGGAGDPTHYQFAIRKAEEFSRLLMIESSSANVPGWQSAATRWACGAVGQVMMPPPGLAHPTIAKEELQ